MTPVDTTCELLTPEHVRFQFRLAGVVTRSWAYLIDSVLKTALLFMVLIGVAILGDFGIWLVLIAMFAIEWLYFLTLETIFNGQTPGKMALGVRVISQDGTPLRWHQCIIRNLIRPADQFPLLYGIGGLFTTCTEHGQRLGDLAAGTVVVFDERATAPQLPAVARKNTDMLMSKLRHHLGDDELRQAVLLYAAKRAQLSRGLRRELALPLTVRLCESAGLPADTDPDRLMCACYRLLTER